MSRVLVTPVVSLPHPSNWSQVVDHVETNFHCVIALSVFGQHAKGVGKTIAQMVKSADLSSVEQYYELLVSSVRLAEESAVVLHLSSVYLSNQEMACAAAHGTVCLKRSGRLGRVVIAGEELQLRMGRQEPEDVLLLATEHSGFFLDEVEQKFAQGYETDTIITSIIPGVQSADEKQPCVMAFLSQEPVGNQVDDFVSELRMSAELDDQGKSEAKLSESVVNRSEDQVEQTREESPPLAHKSASRRVILDPKNEQQSREQQAKTLSIRPLIDKSGVTIQLVGKKLASGLMGVGRTMRRIKSPFSSGVYLDQEKNSKFLRIVVLAGLAVAAIVSMWWWYARSQERARQEAVATVAPFISQLQSAQTIVSNDPLTAREQVAQVVSQLEELGQSEEVSGITAQFVAEELSKAKEMFISISGKEELSELPIYYDLRLIRSDFVASLAQGGGDRAVFIDQGKQQAAVLDLKSKQLTVLSLEQVGQVRSAAMQGNQLFILADGVFVLPIEEGAAAEKVIDAGDSNAGGQLLGAYESYLYVLNPEKRNIYRYLEESGEYSKPIGWLVSSLGSSLQDAVSLAIDGDFWLTTESGEIRKYTSGRLQDFTVKGMTDAFNSSIQLVTSAEVDQLFILEPNNKRLVILEKDGTFLREVKNTALGSATALVVSTELKKAFVVSGSMIFEVAL